MALCKRADSPHDEVELVHVGFAEETEEKSRKGDKKPGKERHAGDELDGEAADGPEIDGFVVFGVADKEFGGAVPPGGDFGCPRRFGKRGKKTRVPSGKTKAKGRRKRKRNETVCVLSSVFAHGPSKAKITQLENVVFG